MQDFEYKEINGKIELTKYLGNEKEVIIPAKINGKNVTSIGSACFLMSKIESVVLSDNIIEIKDNAFNSCSNLNEVLFNDILVNIGSNAFCGCRSLKEIVFPPYLEKVADYAFSWCSGLEEVHFPFVLLERGDKGFCFCSKLKTVILHENE